MIKKHHTENTVGPWAKIKLKALEDYLNAYSTALKKQGFKRIYIDAFAGSPKNRVRKANKSQALDLFLSDDGSLKEQEEFILGSPLRALNVNPSFHHYYFFDLDKTRADKLKELSGERDDVTVSYEDCNSSIVKLANSLKNPDIRGIAFLDPYGPHLKWTTIEALAETKTMEVVINFPLGMSINRLIRKTGDIPEKWNGLLDDCFGTHLWHDLAYEDHKDLFQETIKTKRNDVAERLLNLYLNRLKKIFKCVSKPRLIKNTQNSPLYYLIWAGPHSLGLKIADHVLQQGEKV